MNPTLRRVSFVAGAVALAATGAVAAFTTSVQPYLASLDASLEAVPLISAGDRVPCTVDPSRQFQMVGIPDGLGAYADDGRAYVYMNAELGNTATSEPNVGQPLLRGAFVSELVLDAGTGDVLSGSVAYDDVYVGSALAGPTPTIANTTPSFSRFCSGWLGGPGDGFDRWIYFCGEESGGAQTFSGTGGQALAIFDRQAHILPDFAKFPKENVLFTNGYRKMTVGFATEDGPSSPDSQLYMYIGEKDRRSRDPLVRNGLVGGKLYVFVSNVPGKTSEPAFTEGTITGRFVEIPNAASMTEAQLEAAADGLGAFGFIRIEDAEINPNEKNEMFFVTTGGATGNTLGRGYLLRLDRKDPLATATLQLVYNADAIVAAGGDVAVSPDNVGWSRLGITVCEDGTSQSRPVMASKGRDGSVWFFPVDAGAPPSERVDVESRARLLELDAPGRDGVAVGAGIWESSGIIPTDDIFGDGTWLIDVQAHPPTTAPAPGTVEDGQLLLVRPRD